MMNVSPVVQSSCCCATQQTPPPNKKEKKPLKTGLGGELSVSVREKKLVDFLRNEYASLSPEQFSSYEDYQNAKQISYERLQDAMDKYHEIVEEADANNANNFAKVMNSIGSFVEKVGGKLIRIGARLLLAGKPAD